MRTTTLQTSSIDAVFPVAVDAEALDAEALDAEAVDAEALDAEALDAEAALDAESMESFLARFAGLLFFAAGAGFSFGICGMSSKALAMCWRAFNPIDQMDLPKCFLSSSSVDPRFSMILSTSSSSLKNFG
eukprot:78292-Hanusia_phi.AAC.1